MRRFNDTLVTFVLHIYEIFEGLNTCAGMDERIVFSIEARRLEEYRSCKAIGQPPVDHEKIRLSVFEAKKHWIPGGIEKRVIAVKSPDDNYPNKCCWTGSL